MPLVLGILAVLVTCAVGVVAVGSLVLRSGAAGSDQPYPPYPNEQAEVFVMPTPEQQRWALALSAVLAMQNGDRHDTLIGYEGTPAQREELRVSLQGSWGVSNREDLLDSLEWIENGGHRSGFDRENGLSPGTAGIAAWDYGRYVALCRWGYALGYLSEEEAWQRIMPVARLMQSTYSSWSEYSQSYVIGREYWSPNAKNEEDIRGIRWGLLAGPQSPWVQIPWDTDLGSPQP